MTEKELYRLADEAIQDFRSGFMTYREIQFAEKLGKIINKKRCT